MQQAALPDIFNQKYWKGRSNCTEDLVSRAQIQLQTLNMQSKRYLNIQLGRVQKAILNWIHHFCSGKPCKAVTLCEGDLLELPALLHQQGRAVTTPVRKWRAVKTGEVPGTTHLEAGRVCPCRPPPPYKHSPPQHPSQPADGYRAQTSGYPRSGHLRSHCWLFCLGLHSWLLVSKYKSEILISWHLVLL